MLEGRALVFRAIAALVVGLVVGTSGVPSTAVASADSSGVVAGGLSPASAEPESHGGARIGSAALALSGAGPGWAPATEPPSVSTTEGATAETGGERAHDGGVAAAEPGALPFGVGLSDSVADRGAMRFPPASPLAQRHVYRDGGQSTPLSDGRTLWLFSDTVLDDQPVLTVHNSAALTSVTDPEAIVDPLVNGKPTGLVDAPHDDLDLPNHAGSPELDCPATKSGLPLKGHPAWPTGAVSRPSTSGTDEVLVFYLNVCVYLGTDTAFAYELLSMGVASFVYDPADYPEAELADPASLPPFRATVVDNTLFRAPDLFGASPVLADPDGAGPLPASVHVYRCQGDLFDASCRVARAPIAQATTSEAYRFWDGDGYDGLAPADAAPLVFGAEGVPFGGMQIAPLPPSLATASARFVQVATLVPADRLWIRTAPAPEGPWSDARILPIGPCGVTWTTGCYAPTVHPSLSSARGLGLSLVNQIDRTFDLATIPVARADRMSTLPRPVRIVDSRTGQGRGPTGAGSGPAAPIAPAATVPVRIGGRTLAGHAIPASATAALVNLTVVSRSSTTGTHLLAAPSGGPAATGSTANTPAGRTRANSALVPLGPDGALVLTNGPGLADIIVDLLGWVGPTAADLVHPAVTPTRILDTRTGIGVATGAVGPGGTRTQPVAGRTLPGGIAVPASATALIVNLTAVAPTAATHVTAHASGSTPGTSNLNLDAGLTRANLVAVPLGADGGYTLRNNSGSTHLVVDLVGWLAPDLDGGFAIATQSPVRAVDTRSGRGVGAGGHPGPAAPLGAGATSSFTVAPAAGTSTATGGVLASVTGVLPTAATHLTVSAAGASLPATSSLNLPAGETVANLALLPVSANSDPDPGRTAVRNNSGTVDALLDVVAWLVTP